MKSNKGLIKYKRRVSFINKKCLGFLIAIIFIFILGCSYLLFSYWKEIPTAIEIFLPVLLGSLLTGIIITPLNGMYINKKGNITLIDFKFEIIKLIDLDDVIINFIEWKNNKYFAVIKFKYKNGKILIKDYYNQFNNRKKNKLVMLMYTIRREEIKKLLNKIDDLNFCDAAIIDKNGNMIYQKN